MSRQFQDKFMLRLPDGWRDAIKNKAAKNRRSMTAEILFHLEKTVATEQTANEKAGEPTTA